MPPRAIGRIHQDDLVRYSRPLNGKQLYVTTNPRAVRQILTGRFPTRVTIVTNMRAPDKEGLPMESEAVALNDAEDALMGSYAGGTNQLISAGRLTYNGQRVLIFHSELQQPLGPGPAFVTQARGFDWNIYYEHDPDGWFVQGVMVPSPVEERRAYDHRQVGRLEELGDDLAIPRQITLHATFSTNADVASAIAILNDAKFRCDGPNMQKDRSWTAQFHYDCAADEESIDRLTGFVQSVCAQCSGRYDGWDCSTAH